MLKIGLLQFQIAFLTTRIHHAELLNVERKSDLQRIFSQFSEVTKLLQVFKYCRDSNNGHTKCGLVTRTWFEYPDQMARFLGYFCNLGPSFLRTGPLCPVFGCCSVLYLDGIRHLDTLLPFQYWTSRVFGSPPYKLRNILNVAKFPTIKKKWICSITLFDVQKHCLTRNYICHILH